MSLSQEQLNIIRNTVDHERIRISTLRDDVIDHLCCVVEYNLQRGKTFEASLRDAVHELAPNGLDEIERETVFLLNRKKIIRMKTIMYSVGLLSTVALSVGTLFRLLHWPGGEQLFTTGYIGFLLVYVPLWGINYFKVNIQKALSEKLRLALGVLSGVITGTAAVLKVTHMPGADILLIIGMLLFSFGFLPFLFFTMYKKSITQP